MGLIGNLLGAPGTVSALGSAARDVAEVFTPSATKQMELSAKAQMTAMTQFGEEFQSRDQGAFDRFVNALNRLPRPFLAFGTIGLFVYAMVDPRGFGFRMTGLSLVPEPLWWLLAAIVGFYFGSREAFHYRNRPQGQATLTVAASEADEGGAPAPAAAVAEGASGNAALDEWRAGRA